MGVGLSSFAGALGALAMNLAPNRFALSDMVTWMLGSVTNRSLDDLMFVAPFWIVGVGLAALTAPGLRALALGEETAQTLGVHLCRTRAGVIGAAHAGFQGRRGLPRRRDPVDHALQAA